MKNIFEKTAEILRIYIDHLCQIIKIDFLSVMRMYISENFFTLLDFAVFLRMLIGILDKKMMPDHDSQKLIETSLEFHIPSI